MAKTDRGYGPLDNHMYMYDLGWLVKTILGFQEELDTAIDLKTIHYADPIQWDITTQYSPNTVVIDPKTGTAYMSKVPVPAGIQLDNTDYWVVIFNYQRIYDKIMSGVAFNDKDNLEASKDISKYDFVWFGGDLYQAQRDIPQGSKYVPGVNIVSATIADALATYYGRDRVAQVINDTLTASETQTIGAKNRVINVTGDQTVTAGDIAETSANRTIKTTSDYHIDVDGNLSDHVDGVTTINRGGAVTEAYDSSLDVGVTGTYTAEYSGAVTETYKGKRNVTGKDTTITASGNITASANQFDMTSATKTFPIRFPDKVIDLYNIQSDCVNVRDFGAVGNALYYNPATFKWFANSGFSELPHDDGPAIQAAIDYAVENHINTVLLPSGGYYTPNRKFTINASKIKLQGEQRTNLISDGLVSGAFITIISDTTLEEYNYHRTPIDNISVCGTYFKNDANIVPLNSVIGISIGTISKPEVSVVSPHLIITDCSVQHFNIGVALLSAYKSSMFNCSVIACDYGFYSDNNTALNSIIPWHIHQAYVECCAVAIYTTAYGFSAMHFIGGAFEYNRQVCRSYSKLYFNNVRFENDLVSACDNSGTPVYSFVIDDSNQSEASFVQCTFLFNSAEYANQVTYWIPKNLQFTTTKPQPAIFFTNVTAFTGTYRIMLIDCNFATNQNFSGILVNDSMQPVTYITGWNTQYDVPYYISAGSNIFNWLADGVQTNTYYSPVENNIRLICGTISGTAQKIKIELVQKMGSAEKSLTTVFEGVLTNEIKFLTRVKAFGGNYIKLTAEGSPSFTSAVINTIQ